MGSRCAKLSTGHGRSHESSMKKLMACVSQDNFSLSSEGEEEAAEEEEEEEEAAVEEEELPVQGKLLLMETEQQEEGTEEGPMDQLSPKPKPSHS
ncbi:protamine-3 [Choloepus didactylus]|uniref:protamine-3 n=1 Tax=Choloepus didactylus TaxID=27675 RepID=UPI0018A06440|nr:protamine-3 [Choloepus didactylus]